MKTVRLAAILAAALLLGACRNLFTELEPPPSGQGTLFLSFGSGGGFSSARTILPTAPEFSRYELEFVNPPRETLSLLASSTTLYLNPGVYTVIGKGYTGTTLTARSDPTDITISPGGTVSAQIALKPYTESAVHGVLSYSLALEGIAPVQAELLIETYTAIEGLAPNTPIPADWILPRRDYAQDPTEEEALAWNPPAELSLGSEPGTILLLSKTRALQALSGSISLPAGEYLLTMRVSMDGGAPVKRTDIAQIYSGLTSAGYFRYGGGEISLTGASSFINSFTFDGIPNAATVISGTPGPDGSRVIMVTVPSGTDPASLTPKVETIPGTSVSSPSPTGMSTAANGDGLFTFPDGDYSGPTSWTAVDEHGNTQDYTVMVSIGGNDVCSITEFYFKEFPGIFGSINQNADPSAIITITLPYGTKNGPNPKNSNYNLTPVFLFIGQKVEWYDPSISGYTDVSTSPVKFIDTDYSINNSISFQKFRVVPFSGTGKEYTVQILETVDDAKVITNFKVEGYPGVSFNINTNPISLAASDNIITGFMPYGISLTDLKPLIQYRGTALNPSSGVSQNFTSNVIYTVTAEDGSTREYTVIIKNEVKDSNAGIFNFVVTNVPNAKVVIGRNPRSSDGKIPIVIQVPFGTNEKNMIPAITLDSPTAKIGYCDDPDSSPSSFTDFSPPTPSSPNEAIKFGATTNDDEAYYEVTAQDGTKQEYVVLVSAGGQYYYVNGLTGRDDWPDYYNGESEDRPFKTLAKAVYEASQHASINKIFVSGELNNSTERGAWENASVPSNGFHSGGGSSDSVINLIGTNSKTITVTGINNAVLRGTTGKRVLSITNGAKINFENITVTGGDTPKDGGGVYIDGDCDIQFSGSTITGNKAGGSGGGVYIHGPASGSAWGELSFYGGSISGNTAAGSHTSSADPGSTQGGGGLYVGGRASIWLNNATVANNTAEGGSGGGVLVNGSVFPGPDNSRSHATAEEYGLIMTEGNISGNKSMGSKSPHGGGGIYVAQGAFEMWGGEISGNTSKRQGGGVFIWHNADFRSSGNSRFINNTGVGSSKDICSRGYTTLAGHTRADRVYVWNNNGDNKYAEPDAFYIGEDARITTGLVLAYDDTPSNPRTRNRVNVLDSTSGTDRIANIDLEGHLTGDKFVDTDPEGDWLGVDLVDPIGANTADIGRFTLGAFTGKGDVSLGPYTLDSDGRMVRR